ncbi:MAG TPA: hypothetical protein DD727_07560 [Clostridiales bacterium]|nr:hypothetical protein [Clostridiales bacterium]
MDPLEIYVDVLFFQNMGMDFLVLSLASRFSGIHSTAVRRLAASAAGALATVIMMAIAGTGFGSWMLHVSLQMGILCLMVRIAAGPQKLNGYGRLAFAAMFSGIGMGGVYFLMLSTMTAPAASASDSGHFILAAVRWWDIFWISMLAYAFLSVFQEEIVSRWIHARGMKKVKVVLAGKEAVFKGFIDTGNMLREPVSGAPVALAQADCLGCLLPDRPMEKTVMDRELLPIQPEDWVRYLEAAGLKSRICYIPYQTAGNESGFFTAFRPDMLEVEGRGPVPGAVVGLSLKQFSTDGSFNMIIGSNMA